MPVDSGRFAKQSGQAREHGSGAATQVERRVSGLGNPARKEPREQFLPRTEPEMKPDQPPQVPAPLLGEGWRLKGRVAAPDPAAPVERGAAPASQRRRHRIFRQRLAARRAAEGYGHGRSARREERGGQSRRRRIAGQLGPCANGSQARERRRFFLLKAATMLSKRTSL